MAEFLPETDKRLLLQLARAALEAAVRHQLAPPVAPETLTPALRRPGCSFVTLTLGGELRGCIGALHPLEPLYEDVRHHAGQAALEDYRFSPVSPAEVAQLEIEISVLTEPHPLAYEGPDDLVRQLRPEVDGVVLQQGLRRATFLPQVWESIPDPETFLRMLCEKMGAAPNAWRQAKLDVQTYQVEKFMEAEFRHPPQTEAPDR